MNTSKVWYVTGASRGLGLTLVKTLLAKGYRVAATSRDARMLSQAVGLIDSERFLPLAVDLNNPDCIDESIQQTLAAFGQIDVLVNNAGYGMAGTVEETEEQKIRDIINVNLLATINVTKSVLPVEHKLENISNANKEMNLKYPVAVDSNYEIWRSFQNSYWPALYLIDAKGKIRYQKFGEGDYQEIELTIQQLLKEVSTQNITTKITELQPGGYEAAADWESLQSPENYVGYSNTQGFVSPGEIIIDKQAFYAVPAHMELNQWALSGEWTIGKEKVLLKGKQGKIVYRFHARDLNLIMGPAESGSSLKFRVLIDGKPPGTAH